MQNGDYGEVKIAHETSRPLIETDPDARPLPVSTTHQPVKTDWNALIICAIVFFLTSTLQTTLAVAGYPFLKELDPTVTVVYYGWVSASIKFFHGIGTILFAFQARPLLTGQILSLLCIALYVVLEVFPVETRKYAFFVQFALHALAEGCMVVFRSYVPRMSRVADRTAAFGITNAAMMLSIVAGPLITALFTPIAYPGWEVVPWLRINTFTAPAWVALLLNVFVIGLTLSVFKEPPPVERDEGESSLGDQLRKAGSQIRSMDKKGISSIGLLALMSILAPYINATFNVSRTECVMYLSAGQTVAGAVSILVALLFIFTKLGSHIPCTVSFPLALVLFFGAYLVSFPWPGISQRLTVFNETSAPNGCDPNEFTWCTEQEIVFPLLWLALVCLLVGIALPLSYIAFDTIYAHVLGGIDQNIMQGALIMFDDFAMAAAPLLATEFFGEFGPSPYFVGSAVFMLSGIAVWCVALKRLRKIGI